LAILDNSDLKYRQQHKLRLSYMPWLYWTLKPAHKEWAHSWQREWQTHLVEMETVQILGECFIAPEAKLFAEPGRPIKIGAGATIAADCVLHGPITIGANASINHHVTMDGGRAGISIGAHTRIAAYCHLYAFNHGQDLGRRIADQPVTSNGIVLGEDVWLGANVGVVDGVTIGDRAIVGMDSTVTQDIPAAQTWVGNPARFLRLRD
jgi:acetyltransferase-like isoleucine patch superfamily enzyme